MNHKKKALIILTPGFPENEEDTTCLPERQALVKALKRNAHSTEIIILTFQYPFIRHHYQWQGIDVYAFNGRNKGKLRRAFVWFCVWKTLKILKRKFKLIGLLSFWLGECALIGNMFSKRYNTRHYCWLLGQDAKAGNKYVSLIKPSAEFLIAISDSLADEFFKNYLIRPKHILPVGIDKELFNPLTGIRDIDIIGVGSLIPLKKYDQFIKVIHILNRRIYNLKVVLCGKGPEQQKLKHLISAYSLQDVIELKGELPHPEILQLMQRSSVFLHTSSYEGFAAVFAEALFAGTYVVSSCKPMERPIDHFYYIPDIESMADCIFTILSDKSKQHYPVMPFEIDEIAEKTIELFDN
jgi:glycosyltransferase involved in cell wall biosynthesis